MYWIHKLILEDCTYEGKMMSTNFDQISVSSLCEIIELLSPAIDDYLYVYDYQQDFYFISPHATQRFLLPGNAFHDVGKNLRKLVYPEDYPKLRADLDDLAATDRCTHNLMYRWLSVEEKPIWINCRGTVVRDKTGKMLYMTGCINEIGKVQKADNLSGLLGASSLKLYLSQFTERFPDGYMLRLGLDNLKGINARLGIEYGDLVLQRTSECIAECLLPDQKLYRIMGDEFLILDFAGGQPAEGKELYRRIREKIREFIMQKNYEVMFTISGGLLRCEDADEISYSQVMKLTEFALDEAKRLGKNMCYMYCLDDYQKFLRRRSLMLQLRQAVNNKFQGFEAYYQPLFSAKERRLIGAEALMRFHSPDFGMVSPGEFIPILEETALIIPAGRWILHEALRLCSEIQKYIPDFKISINLSHVQILKSSIGREILAAVNEYGLSPTSVTIELTESGLLETDTRFSLLWSHLKAAGITLALDDFGTGYSNFHYLTDLGPDIVKIDRTFAAKAVSNEFEFEMLSLFSKMIHDLNLKVCVEGVETAAELEKLCQLPPEYLQGFYLGRPCPAGQFVKQFIQMEM